MSEITGGKTFYNKTKDVLLTLSEDNFSAYLTIESSGGIVDENTIKDLLTQAGITNGFEAAARYNRANSNLKEVGKPFLIAQGSNPNADFTVDFKFDRERCFVPDESYDVFEMNKFSRISKGQTLSQIIINNSESIGQDLFGNEVSTSQNNTLDVDELFGDNIYFNEKTNQLIALKSGYPYIDFQDKLQIKTDFYINENVSVSDFELYGDLVINGDVEFSKINIEGDLTVYGKVSGCLVPGIFVNGDFAVDNAENSRLVCSGKFNFHNRLDNCITCAKKEIIGDDESILLGGLTQSAASIRLYMVGCEEPHLAEIEIIFAPFIKEQIKYYSEKLEGVRFIPEGHNEEIETYSSLVTKLEKNYLEIVNQFFEPPVSDHKITITKGVCPETRFRIFDNTHLILDEKSATTFALVDRNIVINEVDKNE